MTTPQRYPTPSRPAVTNVMRANRKTGTKPELALRSLLHRRGLRFRKNLRIKVNGISTSPDVVFPSARLAVFVDGCFWHRCPEHGIEPQANQWYWRAKLNRNVTRDERITERLQAEGWKVIRVWEHEPIEVAAGRVANALSIRSSLVTDAAKVSLEQ